MLCTERISMVYCSKCGTKNEDMARVCVSCGASLETGTYVSRRQERRRMQQECFGLPHGGTIVGLAIGVIILIWGFVMFAQQTGLISETVNVWPIALIIFGLIMVISAIYGLSRRQT